MNPATNDQPDDPGSGGTGNWPELKNQPFSDLPPADHPDWLTVDLSPAANHSFAHGDAWPDGFPFPFLPRGREVLQGVPFALPAEEAPPARTDCLLHPRQKLSLPLPVRRTKAVFLLHSGTFVRPDQRPGSYRLEARDGTTVELELTAPDDSSGTPPTIQDWWSIYPAITGENIRPWPIIDPLGEDSLIGHLHLLRWQPGPAPKAWRKLHIHGPDHPPGSLALLAVTLLLEPRRQSKD